MSIPRRDEGLCPDPPRPWWEGVPSAPRMGDDPRGEHGEDTQPLFRGAPGAIPTTRVSYDDTKDFTETPGWDIPEVSFSIHSQPQGCVRGNAWGAQSPPGQRSVWWMPGRQRGVRAHQVLAREIYTLPSPSGQGAAAIGSLGTRGPPPLAPQWAGIPRHTWSVPVSPSHPGTTPRLEGKGR